MTGGTQLVEGAHLTGGDMRFCCESSKSQYLQENNTSLSALLFFIDNINTVLTLFMQFCRKFSFVAITRFLGGTFGRSVAGGAKTF